MKDLLEQAQSLNDSLERELAEARTASRAANSAAAAARLLKSDLESKLFEVEKRERDVSSAEKPGNQLAEASRIKAENTKLATEIHEAKDKLNKERDEFRAEVAASKAALKEGQEELANTRENFRVQADALREKEKKFEAKLKELGLKVA